MRFRMYALLPAFVFLLPCQSARAFGFSEVSRLARDLAATPYKAPESTLPKEMQGLTHEQYAAIRFKPERARWRNAKLQFELSFHHQGHNFVYPVRINEVTAEGVSAIRFSPDDFDYGGRAPVAKGARAVGFSGFRVHFPLHAGGRKDEFVSFLGASYFRAVGRGQQYGAAARGLAVDTALMSGEEFPRFVEYWIERPNPASTELVVHALLDSTSVTGAYQFILRPGVNTITDVRARIFPRRPVSKLAIAPLTSMYLFGENQRAAHEDHRPEVHDSDGLSIQSSSGEWIWRPLINPRRLLVTSFALTNPQGFGLMQRDRSFGSYENLAQRYDLRPSVWVEPKGHWGEGRIELVQLPTPDETNANVTAFWVPAAPLKPRQPHDFDYRITWQKDNQTRPPSSWIMQTRRGQISERKVDNSVLFAIDFVGPAIAKLPEGATPVAVPSVADNGEILGSRLIRNEVTGGWRLLLQVRQIDPKKAIELRAVLRDAHNALSETWSYILPPS